MIALAEEAFRKPLTKIDTYIAALGCQCEPLPTIPLIALVVRKRSQLRSYLSDPQVDDVLTRSIYPDGVAVTGPVRSDVSDVYVIREKTCAKKNLKFRITAPVLTLKCLKQGTARVWKGIWKNENHIPSERDLTELFPTTELFLPCYLDYPGQIAKKPEGGYISAVEVKLPQSSEFIHVNRAVTQNECDESSTSTSEPDSEDHWDISRKSRKFHWKLQVHLKYDLPQAE